MKKQYLYSGLLPILIAGCMIAKSDITKELDEKIATILARAIKPDGRIDNRELMNLNNFFEMDETIGKLGAGAAAALDRITKIRDQAARASQILRNGYDLERYKNERSALEQKKSRYAQSLINRMVRDWKSAVSVLEGYPIGSMGTPSPYDMPYDAIVSQYLIFAQKLEDLGDEPSIAALKKLNQDFLTQFDRMLTINDIGRDRKKLLIEWLGGEKNYLGSIMGSMIIARSPGFPASGIVRPS